MSGIVHVEHVMGTAVTIDLRWADDAHPDVDRTAAAIATAVSGLHEADRVFSTWRTDSDLSRLRRGDLTVDECDPSMITVIGLCATAAQVTGGWFDAWRMPGGFDPTGLVKGWAAAEASSVLALAGFTNHCVNAGGDVCIQGDANPSSPTSGWRVGVTDPRDRRTIIDTIVAQAGGVATSGCYERGSLAVDPHTGDRVTRLASATVIGPDLALADALATAATAAGPEMITRLEQIPDYSALLIDHDGQQVTTPNWPTPS